MNEQSECPDDLTAIIQSKDPLATIGSYVFPGRYYAGFLEDWNDCIKKLCKKTDRYTFIYDPVKWEHSDMLTKIYENIHPENAPKTFYCNGDIKLKEKHEKFCITYHNLTRFSINVYSFPWVFMQRWLWRNKKYTEKSGMKGCFGDTYITHADLDYNKKYKIVCPVNHPKINRVMTLGRLAEHHEFAYSFKNTDTIKKDGSFTNDEFNAFVLKNKKYYHTKLVFPDSIPWNWAEDGNHIVGEGFMIPVDHNIEFPINDFNIQKQKYFTDIFKLPTVWPEDIQENDYHNYFPTLEWLQSHIELIHETYCVSSGSISEKTAKAVGHMKPFLTIGCQNWYKYFESYGFQLYDELFDYSFDSLPSYKDRWEHIMNQCDKILDTSHNELNDKIEKMKPKLKYNKEIMKSIGRSYFSKVVDVWALANRILLPSYNSFGFIDDKN
mgnify:CR=1 FL=1